MGEATQLAFVFITEMIGAAQRTDRENGKVPAAQQACNEN
jgi:hypothetical protein